MMRFLYLLLALLYVLSPYDLLPDVIIGLGWLDDIIVLIFLFRYLMKLKTSTFYPPFNEYVKDKKNPFSILGIHSSSKPETIKNAYRKLANQYHPDKVAHMGKEQYKTAESRFLEIKEAYEKLQDMGRV